MDTLIFHFLITPAADGVSDGSSGTANLQVRTPQDTTGWGWGQQGQAWCWYPTRGQDTLRWGPGSMSGQLYVSQAAGPMNSGPVLMRRSASRLSLAASAGVLGCVMNRGVPLGEGRAMSVYGVVGVWCRGSVGRTPVS